MLCANLGRELESKGGTAAHVTVGSFVSLAHHRYLRVGRRLRGLLSRWVTLGLNDLRSPPTLSDDSRDKMKFSVHCTAVLYVHV